MADDIPGDVTIVVGPTVASDANPTLEQKPDEEKPKRSRAPRAPRSRKSKDAEIPAATEPSVPQTLDPLFFAGLNSTLKRMMREERATKLSSLAIV